MQFIRDYLVHYYEIDVKRKLTIPALIHYFEDIAILNSEARGYTLEYYDKTNHGFMLIKWNIKIHSMPDFNDTITIITQPYSFKRFLANRKYRVENKNGKLLAEAKTLWVFADTKTRKPDRIPEDLYLGFDTPKENEKYFEMLEDPAKLTGGTFRQNIVVKIGDLDSNDHVNNVRYIDWALESLPKGFLNKHSACDIKVNYVKELSLGDESLLYSEIKNENGKITSNHSFYCGEKDICHVEVEWLCE
jgi:medium-chain acyl-[acyl-carrier-protein] hydrolase